MDEHALLHQILAECMVNCGGCCRFSGVEKLKDKAAAAAQAILEPGIATDGGQQMSREQFGLFIRRFAAASGVTFSAITDFLLVVPVFDYDPAFTDPGMHMHDTLCMQRLVKSLFPRAGCIR